ncbi:MAG: DUF799 family lipoprotein [Desulfobacterales bacterium]|nr:DUF799 family lipoprotein [Desulfobacterales bacterium]
MKNTAFTVLVVICLLLAVNGCAIKNMLMPDPEPAVLEKDKLPHKVAIVPFVNKTSNPEAGSIVRKMFYNFFSSLNYLDLEPFVIDDNLKRNELYQAVVSGEPVAAARLGQLLGVDAVIFGEVTSLGKTYALVYSDNSAGLKAKMVRCDSEQIIWELEHSIHIQDGDVPLSLTGLAATIVKTAITHQKASHLQAAAELCMQMVATIPDREGVSEPPPKIIALVHNGAGKLLRPGDLLKVAMIGEKNQKASWSIPPLVNNLPLKEKEPGVYIGAYRIRSKDRLPHGRIVGYLRSKIGTGSQWVDTLGPIKIGEPTVLPPKITKNTVLTAAKSPYLVEDALVVLPGAKLTVQPGTVIWFLDLGLIVKGELRINGTEEAPVRFASLGASSWKGIFLDKTQNGTHIRYCQISDAEFGLRVTESAVNVQNCLFQNNVWGIVLEHSTAEIRHTLVRTSGKIGIAARKAQLVVENSVITENGAGGFILEKSKAKIEQNNIVNNGNWAIKVADTASKVKAKHNWWGVEDPEQTEIVGQFKIQPILEKPIEFRIDS